MKVWSIGIILGLVFLVALPESPAQQGIESGPSVTELEARIVELERLLPVTNLRMRRNRHCLFRSSCSYVLFRRRSEKPLALIGTEDKEALPGETFEESVDRRFENHLLRMYRLKLATQAQNETFRRLHNNINWIQTNWVVGGPDYPGDK